jgi:malonyl-CoA/methylmalonyl-CoA synthetase
MLSLPPIVARAAAYGARTAVVDLNDGRSYSYGDLLAASGAVSTQLLAGRADLAEERVAFLVNPGFDHVAVEWGIWRAGGIAVPLPLAHLSTELDYLIRDAEAGFVIADAEGVEQLAPIGKAAGARFYATDELLTRADLTASAKATASLAVARQAARRRKVGTTDEKPYAVNRRAMIIYTSGTTGRPKGVVTTHANIAAQIESLVTAWEWTSDDRTLLALPLHHVHGIINVVCSALWSGATCEMLPKFESEATWDRLASGELTVFTAVPTIYHRLTQSWESAAPEVQKARSTGCRSLRLMMSGSAALPRRMLDRWQHITGHLLLERYGMTEVGMALSNPLHGKRQPGFVGQPLPGVSVRVVDGELQLKGAGVFSEYWKQPESTRASFSDGWFRTGDIAVVENGAYRLLGRSSVDIIKSGGDKISALEIEEALRAHPGIGECAVVGVDDPEWGQRLCAAVELRPGNHLGLSDLREWARTRLAAYKIPKDLVCVSRLPRNSMGKVLKAEVAMLFARPARPAPREP